MDTPSPDRETLLNYLYGKLSDDESDRIAQLIETDPAVRNQLDELDRSGDTFIEMLRQEEENTPTEGYSECDDALDQVKKIFDHKNKPNLGEYELLERIGQGGMGVVFKARHTKLGRTVAIKVIADARAADALAIARFEREIKAIGQLEHPSIVHAHDAREIDGRSILVMEYVDGLDLGRIVRRHGPIATPDACELIRQTAIGLQAAHEHGLVHRDVKPSNLMLDRQGNLKILDLGLAREATDLNELRREISMSFDLTQTGQAMGTADYMAPEQADHPGMVDIRADIYSLGCTLFKLLTGRAPYHEEMTFDKLTAHAETPLPPTPDLPNPLREILERMTAKNPADRFGTPAEVAQALEPFCPGHDLPALLARAETQTAPAHTLPRTASGGRFRRIITILLLMALTGGVGLFGGIVLTIKRNDKETKLEIPDGTQATIDEKGNVAVDFTKQNTRSISNDLTLSTSESTKDEQEWKMLTGTWKVVDAKVSGLKLPEGYIDRVKMTMVIEKGFITNHFGDNEMKMPCQIDITTVPKQIRSLDGKLVYFYKLNGDYLELCGPLDLQDGMPTDFVSEPNPPNQSLMTFKRVKPGEDKTMPVPTEPQNAGASPAAKGDAQNPISSTSGQEINPLAIPYPQNYNGGYSETNPLRGEEKEKTYDEKIAEMEKSPNALVTFQPVTGSTNYYPAIDDWAKLQKKIKALTSEEFEYLWIYNGPFLGSINERFEIDGPTTIFLQNGKEVFRQKGNVDSKKLWEQIDLYLPPIGLALSGPYPRLRADIPTTYMLIAGSRPGHFKRCAGKTLRVTWPEGLKPLLSDESYKNLESNSIEWKMSEGVSGDLHVRYDLAFQFTSPLKEAKFTASILSEKGEVEASTTITRNITILPDPGPEFTPFVSPNTEPIPTTETGNKTNTAPNLSTLDQAIEEELAKLQGTWKPLANREGEKMALIEKAMGNLTISKDFFLWPDASLVVPFTIDPTTDPKRLTLTFYGEEQKILGIYKIENERLTLSLGRNQFPTNFSLKESPTEETDMMVLERAKPNDAWTSHAMKENQSVPLPGVWKLIERPNRDGCLILGGGGEKTPEVSVTFTDEKLYLRGEAIVNRQFSYEVSPDGKNINLLDGRNQVYRGVMSVEPDGKRLTLVCGEKERPAGSWEYFGTDFDRLVLERNETEENPPALASDEQLRKTWFPVTLKPSESKFILDKSLEKKLIIDDGGNAPLLLHAGLISFSTDGHLTLDTSPFVEDADSWPQRWTYCIDPSATPKQLDVIAHDGTAMKGIYKIEDNKLCIRFAPQDHSRPQNFTDPRNPNLVEAAYCCSPPQTPEQAVLLITMSGPVLDGQFMSDIDACIPPITELFQKHPEMKVVIDSAYMYNNLLTLRHHLLDTGIKSVQIKLNTQQPPFQYERMGCHLLENVAATFDIPADELETLVKQLPKAYKTKRLIDCKTRRIPDEDPLTMLPPLFIQDMTLKPDAIRVTLSPETVERFQKTKLDPSQKVAISVDTYFIIAISTIEMLQKGTFDIDCKLTENERKILMNSVKRDKKQQTAATLE